MFCTKMCANPHPYPHRAERQQGLLPTGSPRAEGPHSYCSAPPRPALCVCLRRRPGRTHGSEQRALLRGTVAAIGWRGDVGATPAGRHSPRGTTGPQLYASKRGQAAGAVWRDRGRRRAPRGYTGVVQMIQTGGRRAGGGEAREYFLSRYFDIL